MRTILSLLPILLICSTSSAQEPTDKLTDSIVNEGKELYKSEMASWYGTDVLLEKFKDLKERSGGYFSYNDRDRTNCIFFTKEENPRVLVAIQFDSSYNVDKARIDSQQRSFTDYENDLYIIRKLTLSEIMSDSLFKTYKNTNLNVVPLIYKGQKKAFVLTGPQVSGVVVFGNDYLLTFDNDSKLIGKKQLHKNIMPINYGKQGGQDIVETMHSHLPSTGAFITSTDICTLMLYEKIAKWKQHIVVSREYVSIWDCEKNELTTLTKKAWDRIYEDMKKRTK